MKNNSLEDVLAELARRPDARVPHRVYKKKMKVKNKMVEYTMIQGFTFIGDSRGFDVPMGIGFENCMAITKEALLEQELSAQKKALLAKFDGQLVGVMADMIKKDWLVAGKMVNDIRFWIEEEKQR